MKETKKTATKPYQFKVDPELLKKAMEKAEKEGLKISQVLRMALIDYLNNPQIKLF